MKKKLPDRDDPATLRRRAEEEIRERQQITAGGTCVTHPAADLQRLVHELEVHQVELEMQNLELRSTREDLEAALEKYTDLYDFAPAGHFTLTSEGLIRQVNLTGAALTGAARSGLIGKPFRMLLAARHRRAFAAFLREIQADGPAHSADFELERPNLAPVIVYITARRPGNGSEYRTTVMDITARKHAEEAFRESSEFNRSILESSPDCIKILDPAGNLLAILHGAPELLGTDDVRRYLNKSWLAFWEGEDPQEARNAVAEAAAGGEGNFVGFTRPLGDEPKWWDVRLTPIRDGKGKVSRLLAVSRDVTERRHREMNLAFVASIGLDLVQCMDLGEVFTAAAAKIGVHFGLSGWVFTRIEGNGAEAVITEHWHRADVPAMTGPFRPADFVKQEFISTSRAGGVIAVGNTATDPRTIPGKFASLNILSFVMVPLLRDGQWVSSLGFYRQTASAWQESDIALMRELATRLWGRIEQLQAGEALRSSEERYRTLFNSIDEGFYVIEVILDCDGKAADWIYLEVNPSFEKQTGMQGITGRRVRELVPGLEEIWFEIFGKVAVTGKAVRCTQQVKALAGSWFEFYAFRIGGEGERKVAVISTNVTERRNTEQELREKARLLDLTHDTIIVRDTDGRITYWNHGAEELYGWSRVEALGKVSHQLLSTQFPTPVEQIIESLERTGRWTGELIHRKRNGRKVTVLVRKTQDRDHEGNPSVVLENITDITARKESETIQRKLEVMTATNRKLEQEIIRRQAVEKSLKLSEREQKRLLKLSRLHQQQLQGVSHQLLNAQEEERKRISRELHDVIAQTLISINVHVAALGGTDGGPSEDLRQRIAHTRRLVEQSVETVHRFARELRPTMLDDLGVIPALQSGLKSFMEDTGVRVRFTAAAEVEHCSDIVRTMLYRVAQEALTNVARHAGATSVDVMIEASGDIITLTIRDDGRGFVTEGNPGERKSRRLGLLGMKERVEMVGGTLRLDSSPGDSTTVIAEFPAAGLSRKKRSSKDSGPDPGPATS